MDKEAFVWNEFDFIRCLDALPVVEANEASHHYTVRKDGLRLSILVRQFDRQVNIAVFKDGLTHAVIRVNLTNCLGARFEADDQGGCLEFAPANAFSENPDGKGPFPIGVRVRVNPSIQVRFFGSEGLE